VFSLSHIAQRFGSHQSQTSGISDVQTVQINDDTYVFVTSQENGLITSYVVNPSGGLEYVDQLVFSGAGTPSGLVILAIDGSLKGVPLGHSSTNFGAFDISQSGGFVADSQFLGAAASNGNFLAADVIDINGSTYIYASHTQNTGVIGYKLQSDGTLDEHPAGDIDTVDQTFDAATSVTVEVAGTLFHLVPSQTDNSLTSYWIKPNGVAKFQTKVGIEQNLGVAVPNHVEKAVIGADTFVLMASAGSSSITVLQVLEDGNLIITDHVIDELTTRFQATTVFEVVPYDDRIIVLAGGSDDGLTLMELMPDGTLLHHDTIADALNTSLGNVSALTAYQNGDHIKVFAGSPLDGGISEFEVDLGDVGPTFIGGTTSDTLSGTSSDNIIFGDSGDDVLRGKGGADILIDGAGQDVLDGGAGADIFALSNDKQHDIILDFQMGLDRLDLSNYELLRSVSQIAVESHNDGATLTFFQETLRIFTNDSSPLTYDDLVAMSPISLSHMMIGLSPQSLTVEGSLLDDALVGGLGDDQLIGLDGNDTLAGGAGADLLEGGSGQDCADYSLAILGVTVSLKNNSKNAGEAAGDVLVSIEHIVGSNQKDKLIGNDSQNELFGADGADVLRGGKASDVLEGNLGNDRLYGQNGKDILTAGRGSDALYGGNGHDVLKGNGGKDTLDGGKGNDTYYGNNGADTFVFSRGSDTIKDFEDDTDTILIDASVVDDPNMTQSDLLDTYGHLQNGDAILDFGNGNLLTIENVGSLNPLVDDLDLF